MDTFEINEVATYVGPSSDFGYGSDMTVTSALRPVKSIKQIHYLTKTTVTNAEAAYEVVCYQGYSGWVPPRYLRKKRQSEELGSWGTIEEATRWGERPGWNPTKVREPTEHTRLALGRAIEALRRLTVGLRELNINHKSNDRR